MYFIYVCMRVWWDWRVLQKIKTSKGQTTQLYQYKKKGFIECTKYYTFFDHVAILELTQVLIWLYQSQAKSIQLQSF